MAPASTEMPRNIAPSREPIHTRVVRALRQEGSRKAGTPFEMASTPVTAAPPEAKARSTTKRAAPMSRPLPAVPTFTSPDRCSDRTGRWPRPSL